MNAILKILSDLIRRLKKAITNDTSNAGEHWPSRSQENWNLRQSWGSALWKEPKTHQKKDPWVYESEKPFSTILKVLNAWWTSQQSRAKTKKLRAWSQFVVNHQSRHGKSTNRTLTDFFYYIYCCFILIYKKLLNQQVFRCIIRIDVCWF